MNLNLQWSHLIFFVTMLSISSLFFPACNDIENKNKQISETDFLQEIKIGDWYWATENLKVTKFRNGDSIPEAKTAEQWDKAGEAQKPAWCYYDNDPINGKRYGKLYNWYAVSDPRELAPIGWHIPSDVEWEDLIYYLGGANIAGGKMKSIVGWNQNSNATNNSGFSSLPGGCRDLNGTFGSLGKVDMLKGDVGIWWTSTSAHKYAALYWNMVYDDVFVHRNIYNKRAGFSVRCMHFSGE